MGTLKEEMEQEYAKTFEANRDALNAEALALAKELCDLGLKEDIRAVMLTRVRGSAVCDARWAHCNDRTQDGVYDAAYSIRDAENFLKSRGLGDKLSLDTGFGEWQVGWRAIVLVAKELGLVHPPYSGCHLEKKKEEER